MLKVIACVALVLLFTPALMTALAVLYTVLSYLPTIFSFGG